MAGTGIQPRPQRRNQNIATETSAPSEDFTITSSVGPEPRPDVAPASAEDYMKRLLQEYIKLD